MKKPMLSHFLKTSLLFLPLAWIILSAPGCQTLNLKVDLVVKVPNRIDFQLYKSMLYGTLTATGLPADLETTYMESDFFLNDLPRTISLPAQKVSLPTVDFEKTEATSFSELALQHPQSILLSGKLDLAISSHSLVRERRDAKIGKRIRSIVKLNQMILKMDLFLFDTATGKQLWKKSYTQQENEYPQDREAFTLRSLFYKITDRFSRDISIKERRVRRTLLE